MELYHNNMSVCAQKVRLVLAEKELRPTEHHMMLRNGDVHTAEYLAMNPKGKVPVLIDRGQVITESTIICEYLDDAYATHSLSPVDPIDRMRMRQWTILPDASLHRACSTVSIAVAWRHQMIAAGGGQLANRPDRDGATTLLRTIVEKGLETPDLPAAVRIYYDVIGKMANALVQGPWLIGEHYSQADAAMMPYVCRLEDLGLSWFWEGERAMVGEWLQRSKARPNYRGISDYYERSYAALATEKGSIATPRLREMIGGSA